MTVFKQELKMKRTSIAIWCVVLLLLTLLFMALYPSFSNETEAVDKLLENYPEALLKAFGMSTGLPLSSVLGYYAFVFTFLQLCLAIQASNYGFGILSIEEREFTADFLMSKPVSRSHLLLSKLFAGLTSLFITHIAFWGITFLSLELFNDGNSYDAQKIAILLGGTAIFQMFFFVVPLAISMLVKRVRSVIAYSMAFSFGLYILNALRAIIGGNLLGYLTPYYHFDGAMVLTAGKLDFSLTFISVLAIVLSFFVAMERYTKKDIPSL